MCERTEAKALAIAAEQFSWVSWMWMGGSLVCTVLYTFWLVVQCSFGVYPQPTAPNCTRVLVLSMKSGSQSSETRKHQTHLWKTWKLLEIMVNPLRQHYQIMCTWMRWGLAWDAVASSLHSKLAISVKQEPSTTNLHLSALSWWVTKQEESM